MADSSHTTLRKLSPELQERAIVELKEVPERIREDLQYIKDWLKKTPHLKARTDDQWLLCFLRGCKFSLEKTKQKLDAFYMNRTLIPDFFSRRDPFAPEIQRLLKLGMYIPLENPSGPTIFFLRNGVYDPTIDTFQNIYKLWYMITDILMLEDDNFVVSGNTLIADMKYVTLAHYVVPAGYLEKTMIVYQKALPHRVKGFYFMNSTTLTDICFNILKPFMGNKLRSKVKQFNGNNMDELYAEYPQKLFPKEYGGEAGPIDYLIDKWKKKVESYAEWFKEDEKYCTDEKLRPEKPKTVSDVFGVEGSLRRINFDS